MNSMKEIRYLLRNQGNLEKNFLFIVILLTISSCSLNLISQEREEIKHNSFKYSIEIPEGWNYTAKEEINNGQYIILNKDFRPYDTSMFLNIFPYQYQIDNIDFPSIMVYTVSKISSRCPSLQSFVDSLQNKYKDEFSLVTGLKNDNVKIGENNDQKLSYFVGNNKAIYISLCSKEESDYIITFILVTRSLNEYNELICDFKKITASYVFVSDTTEDEDRNNIFSKGFDYQDLARKKSENIHNYYVSLSSLAYLEYAYKNKSKTMLDTFFNARLKLTIPCEDKDLKLKPEIEQEVYKIFKIFYKPQNLKSYSAPYWGHGEYEDEYQEIYSNVKYILVQNSISVKIIDSTFEKPRKYNSWRIINDKTSYYREISNITFNDFSPKLMMQDKQIVFCDKYFLETINKFLGIEYSEGTIYHLPRPLRETQSRLNFLNQLVKIIPGHWGGYYHIESFPLVLNIELKSNLKEASVFFKNVYAWYRAHLMKDGEDWKITSSGLMFVE